jgi:hypothetical protein
MIAQMAAQLEHQPAVLSALKPHPKPQQVLIFAHNHNRHFHAGHIR